MSCASLRRKREELRKRQGNRCYYCQRQMNSTEGSPLRCTVEHLTRRADGGSNHINNLVAACQECNNRRGAEEEARNPGRLCSPSALARPNVIDWEARGWAIE